MSEPLTHTAMQALLEQGQSVFTFGRLEAAQAEGDLLALRGRGRPAIRVDDLEMLDR